MFTRFAYKIGGAVMSVAFFLFLLHLFAIPVSEAVPTETGLQPAGDFFRGLVDLESYEGSEMEAVFRNFGITENTFRRALEETPVHYAADQSSELTIKARLSSMEGAVGPGTLAEVIADRNGRYHVILYPGFLRATGGQRRAHAWHELIHVVTGWSDQQVFVRLAAFGLRLTQPGTVDISNWAARKLRRRG